jgi:hypothetical protein
MTKNKEKILLDTIGVMGKSILKLDKRIRRLEKDHVKAVTMLGEQAIAESAKDAKDLANFEALMTVIEELALHEGISRAEFQMHYDSLYQHCLERYLQKLEETDPRFAGEIDTRTIAEIESTESLSPLFPPPPEDES